MPTQVLECGVGRTAAVGFVLDAYRGVAVRPGKGLPHAQAVSDMVDALTEDPTIKRYEQRKRMLRSRAAAAGPEVLDVALADKIASLRHAVLTGTDISARKLGHYRATLQIGLAAEADDMLCMQLEDLLTVLALR